MDGPIAQGQPVRMIIVLTSIIAAQLGVTEPAQLADALERRLTFPSSLGAAKPTYVRHCARAPEGCRARVVAFTVYFFAEGERAGISPWLLAAVAVQESRLNPTAEGSCGRYACRGIMQIHERWRGAPPYVRSEKTRKRCARKLGACQQPVVSFAADLLQSEVERCDSLDEALGAYNTGRCDRGKKYAARINRELVHLRRLASDVADS